MVKRRCALQITPEGEVHVMGFAKFHGRVNVVAIAPLPPPPTASPTLAPTKEPTRAPTQPAPPPPTAAPTQPPQVYKGCYKDRGSRDIPQRKGNRDLTSCKQQCHGAGYRYVGHQWSRECWCGNTFGKYGTSNGCKACCSNKNGCGSGVNIGGWVNCVYDLAADTPPPPPPAPPPLPPPLPVVVNPAPAYKGCFRDKPQRDIPHREGNRALDSCKTKCREHGYRYLGHQWSRECWCGNTYGSYGTATSCHSCCATKTCGSGTYLTPI